MPCHNHPESASTGTCAGCAEPFCERCLVMVRGGTYCAACKSMAVAGVASQAVAIASEAKTALGVAFLAFVLGPFCFFGILGIVLGLVAIAKAAAARRQIDSNPALGGRGWSHAATFVGAVAVLTAVVSFMIQMKTLPR